MTLLWEKGRQVRSKLGGGTVRRKREKGAQPWRGNGEQEQTDLQVGGDVSPRMRREKAESAGKR